MQHTPNPAAQEPWEDPPLDEHSPEVQQVLKQECKGFTQEQEYADKLIWSYPLLNVPEVDPQTSFGNRTMLTKNGENTFKIRIHNFAEETTPDL